MAPRVLILPVMNPALLTMAAGMRARIESLETLGNNLANVTTNGFKADQEFYRIFLGENARADPLTGDQNLMPVAEATAINFAQGPLEATGSPLDIALSGPGFLVVEDAGGQALYTRAGSLRVSPTGRLETPEGFAVRDIEGDSLTLPREGKVEIAENGEIRVADALVGQIQVIELDSRQALRKAGANFFSTGGDTPNPAAATAVRQGFLEGSNVSPPEAAVRLVQASRHFETLRRAATLISDEMDGRAVERLGSSR